MASKPKPAHVEAMVFVKWHLSDKRCFAPFTGQDWPAWIAFVYLLQCWAAGGGDFALEAMRKTLLCAQQKTAVQQCFVQAIPALLDWGHVQMLWPRIAPDGYTAGLRAHERKDSPTAGRSS